MSSFVWPLVVVPPVPPVAPASPFTALTGAPRRAEELKRLMPQWMETRYGSIIGAILHAIGSSDHRVAVGDRSVLILGTNPTGTILYIGKNDDESVRIQHLLPTVSPSTESVAVSGKDITVNLATDLNANVLSTPLSIRASIEASVAATALVTVKVFNGTGAVTQTREFIPFTYDGLEGARGDVFLRTARGEDLAILGRNYGVLRPFLLALSDAQFRRYIAVLAFKPKSVAARLDELLTIIFGDKATAGWEVYEIRKKTITVEIPVSLLAVGPSTATFLRPDASQNSSNYWTGDYVVSDATKDAIQKVKPTSADPVSPVTNNSVYVSASQLNRPGLVDVVKLVKAAGIKIEFLSKRG